MPRYFLFYASAAGVLSLDQLTKYIVLNNIKEHEVIPVIPGFFDLVSIRNRGAAFGFLNRSDMEWQFWLFLAATLAAVIAILYLAARSPRPLSQFALGLLLGGALGNFVDRLRFRSVVDFLDFYWGQWHWPAFNVADMAICTGAFLTCLTIWYGGKKT